MLQVMTEHEDQTQTTIWSYYPKLDFWESGQILIQKASNFKILVVADHGKGSDGFAAVDDFEFIYESDSVACTTKPSPEPPTTTPASNPCPEDWQQCSDGLGCFSPQQECDMYPDCLTSEDEAGCPTDFLFDDCEAATGLENCGWEEDPHDSLDWVIATKNDTLASGHPVERQGKFLWVQETAGNVSSARARVFTPLYQNSRVDCRIMFYFFATGTVGRYIKPLLYEVRSDNFLTLDLLSPGGGWRLVDTQVGRRPGQFEVAFDRSPGGTYDAAVAVDDFQFVDCDMPRPTEGDCGAEKPFQCNNKVCIEFQQVCDLTDDCGDSSDEMSEYCDDNRYIRNSFEEPDKPLGIFRTEGGDNLQWERWLGQSPNLRTGPYFDHTTFTQKGHYLWLNSSNMVSPEERAFLVSEPFVKSSEEGPDCVLTLNYFMLGSGLGSLRLTVRSDDEQEEEIFSVNGSSPDVSKNRWQRERMIIKKSKIFSQYDITISGSARLAGQGDLAIDDLTFSPECSLLSSSTSSSTSSTTSHPPCEPGSQFTCGDGSCIPLPEFCNFHVDCPYPDMADEATCPDFTDFETCSQGGAPSNCGWTNTVPDPPGGGWQVSSISDLLEEKVPHRPELDWANRTEGHFLFLRSVMAGSSVGVAGPVYSSSSTDCTFTFWIFMSGSNNFMVFPTLTHTVLGMITTLDLLDLDLLSDGVWTHVMIGVGAHNDKFSLGFQVLSSGDWDAAVAVDEVELFECAKPQPEDSCLPGEYHCQDSRACVTTDMLCDFADDCGDESDEDLEIQGCGQYTRINFEDPLNPWGFFNETESSQGFKWQRGNGSIVAGTGPPFDHTTFGPMGHYLYINSSQGSSEDIAWLTTPSLLPGLTNCTVRFFYHLHGAGVGNLTLSLQLLAGDVMDLQLLWRRGGASEGGIDLNKWQRAQVELSSEDSPTRLVWQASVGQSHLGNIGIDDVTFTPGCRFETSTSTSSTTSSTTTSTSTKSSTKTTSTPTTSKKTTKSTSTVTATTATTTDPFVATANPSNPGSQITLIVGLIVGVVLVVVLVVAVVATIKYRYNINLNIRMQSFLNPNYNRLSDDNNTVGPISGQYHILIITVSRSA